MCGHSEATIDGVSVQMEFGYLGGLIKIGDMAYSQSKSPWFEDCGHNPEVVSEALALYSKEQIIDLLVSLVDNATEG